jgi:Caspase domain
MANQACISIGIDRYQFLPPLGYGSADAVAMEHFFIDAAGWSQSQCLLLTDTSPKTGDKSTYPDRENIDRWLKHWSWDTLRAGDLLWFFFSGYGVSFGEEDYLIPIDGKPEDLANTCISIRQLYQQLNDIGVNALVFLDANRAQNATVGGGIGQTTAKLAQKYNIPTFLSCQAHEFSHEDARLGHGLFTTALLETLNYHPDLNLETIDEYLTSRLAELSEHHWKPLQTPVAIIPTGVSIHRPVFSATTQSSINSTIPEIVYTPPLPPRANLNDSYAPYTPPVISIVSSEMMGTSALAIRDTPVPAPKNIPNWAKVGLLLTLVLGAGGGGIYAIQSQSARDKEEQLVKPVVNKTIDANVASVPITSIAQARLFVKPGDATSRYIAILTARKIPADNPAAAEAQQSIQQWSNEIYEIAQGYADRKLWRLAIDTAKMVPADATNYNTAQAAMADWGKNL